MGEYVNGTEVILRARNLRFDGDPGLPTSARLALFDPRNQLKATLDYPGDIEAEGADGLRAVVTPSGRAGPWTYVWRVTSGVHSRELSGVLYLKLPRYTFPA